MGSSNVDIYNKQVSWGRAEMSRNIEFCLTNDLPSFWAFQLRTESCKNQEWRGRANSPPKILKSSDRRGPHDVQHVYTTTKVISVKKMDHCSHMILVNTDTPATNHVTFCHILLMSNKNWQRYVWASLEMVMPFHKLKSQCKVSYSRCILGKIFNSTVPPSSLFLIRFRLCCCSLSFEASLHQRVTTRPNGCRRSCSSVNWFVSAWLKPTESVACNSACQVAGGQF